MPEMLARMRGANGVPEPVQGDPYLFQPGPMADVPYMAPAALGQQQINRFVSPLTPQMRADVKAMGQPKQSPWQMILQMLQARGAQQAPPWLAQIMQQRQQKQQQAQQAQMAKIQGPKPNFGMGGWGA